jgi:uncharacterized protein (TIGR03086 family)
MTTDTEKTTDLLVAVLADLGPMVGRITAEQVHDPTPCTELDVGQLRTHVLSWLMTFAGGLADPGGQAPLDRLQGYTVPADPAAEVASASATMANALRGGAASRPMRLGDSAMPGEMALSMILWEYQVHGWDLARATGQPWSPPAAAAAESLEFAPSMLTGDYQGEGKAFAPRVDVPATAPPLGRLLGLSGRDPAWSARSAGEARSWEGTR